MTIISKEQLTLYSATVARLKRIGINDPTRQIIELAEEINRYRDQIQALRAYHHTREAADALDRMTPKKPEMRADKGYAPGVAAHLCCPTCNSPVINYWKPETKPKHCQFCGQALDWEEEADK